MKQRKKAIERYEKKILRSISWIENKFEEILGVSPEIIKFLDLINAIELATENKDIKGINLKSQSPKMGWSQALTIRKSLQKFKDKGKFIYSYGDFFSQKGYYLASVSDSIFLTVCPVFLLNILFNF